MIITIDGPAGSGKSTTARKLAARLGIPYLDTGAMYRVVTLAALERGIPLDDDAALSAIAGGDAYALDLGPTHIRVTLDGRDVTEEIRSMRVNDNTRYIARLPGVRAALVKKQQALGREWGALVTEGRDQGSVAFPNADAKFFLDAEVQRRAERRFHELLADGEEVAYEDVLANLRTRDESDERRTHGPLTRPADAIHIDTTDQSLPEVLDQMCAKLDSLGLLDGARRAGDSLCRDDDER